MKMTDLSILCKWETLNNRQCIKYLFAPLYVYIYIYIYIYVYTLNKCINAALLFFYPHFS